MTALKNVVFGFALTIRPRNPKGEGLEKQQKSSKKLDKSEYRLALAACAASPESFRG